MSGSPSSSGAPARASSGTESGGETSVYAAPEFPGTPLYRASSSHQVGDPSLDGEGAYLIPFIAGGQSLEMFLTPAEKVNFTEWIEPDQDYSFLTKWGDYTGVFDMIMPHVPDFIAPNAISLLALLAVVQNWYIVQQYDNKDFESLQSVSTIVSLSLYYFAHCIHKRHAERLMNDTPLTYLFKHICDVLALVFIVSAVSQMFCGNERDVDMEMQWIAVHSCQLILFYKHLSAYAREAGVRYFWFIGPGEMVCVCVLCLMVKATFGLDWYILFFHRQLVRCIVFVAAYML